MTLVIFLDFSVNQLDFGTMALFVCLGTYVRALPWPSPSYIYQNCKDVNTERTPLTGQDMKEQRCLVKYRMKHEQIVVISVECKTRSHITYLSLVSLTMNKMVRAYDPG